MLISIYALLSQTLQGNEPKPRKQAVRFNGETATVPDFTPYPGTVSKISSIFLFLIA